MNAENAGANAQTTYVKFEDLEYLAPDCDKALLLARLKEGLESKDWKQNNLAIDILRSINKYYPVDMNQICQTFWKNIIECLNSLRSALSKNTLMFVAELFQQTKGIKLHDQIIAELVPLLTMKCYNDKCFLKVEAQRAIDAMVTNCVYDSTLVAFCKECFSKNAHVSELATKVIARLIGLIGVDLPKLQPNTFRELFVTLAKVLTIVNKGNGGKEASNDDKR